MNPPEGLSKEERVMYWTLYFMFLHRVARDLSDSQPRGILDWRKFSLDNPLK